MGWGGWWFGVASGAKRVPARINYLVWADQCFAGSAAGDAFDRISPPLLATYVHNAAKAPSQPADPKAGCAAAGKEQSRLTIRSESWQEQSQSREAPNALRWEKISSFVEKLAPLVPHHNGVKLLHQSSLPFPQR